MPNIASLLKAEIARVARKEVRAEILGLRKAVTTYRSEIASLKRRAAALEQSLKQLARGRGRGVAAAGDGQTASGRPLRFSAKGLASHRRRLGLSAHDFGLLVGASGQSVYKWESGEARPRNKHLAAIAAVRVLGKRGAARQVEALQRQAA